MGSGILLGKRLTIGDTIGLIAPASPEKAEAVEKGIFFLNAHGFNVKVGEHLYDKWGYLAGSDRDRADDLMAMFADKEVDMILCVRGGYGTTRILPYLDLDIIKKNPKIFMGFSDITTLLNLFYQRCDLTTFHGPMGSSNLEDIETFDSFLATLTKGNKSYEIKNPLGYPHRCGVPGIAEGNLVGGNMSLISATMGTPYEIDTTGKILFMEDVDEEPYAIDRTFTQLITSGKLQKCSGIILGQFKACDLPHYERSLTLQQVIEDRIYPLGKPVLQDFMTGHDYPKLTIPIGAKVRIDSSEGTIQVLEPVVK